MSYLHCSMAAGEQVIWEVQGELYILAFCSYFFIALLIACIIGSTLVFNTQISHYNSLLIICSVLQVIIYLFTYVPFLYYYELYSLSKSGWLVKNIWIALGWTGQDHILIHKQIYYDILICVYLHLPLLLVLIKKLTKRNKEHYFLQAVLGASQLRGHFIGCLVGLHSKGWKKFFFTLIPRFPFMLMDLCFIFGCYYYLKYGPGEENELETDEDVDISDVPSHFEREKQD